MTAEANLHVVNFLDVTFDLTTGKYKPYRKPNDNPLYIHKHSNYPPSISKQLPTSINKRISTLSYDKQTLRMQHQHIRTHKDIAISVTSCMPHKTPQAAQSYCASGTCF